MHNLDHLIPESVVRLMKLDQFEFSLVLLATPCQGRWPKVKIAVGQEIIFNDVIFKKEHISYKNTFNNIKELGVSIEYYDKQDNDTTVDTVGNIIENQSLTISELNVNGIDIVKTQIIYNLGKFYQNLSIKKQQYFLENGIDIGPSHTLCLFENGVWKLLFKFPIMCHFVKYKTHQAPSERWPNPVLLTQIYNLVEEIRNKK